MKIERPKTHQKNLDLENVETPPVPPMKFEPDTRLIDDDVTIKLNEVIGEAFEKKQKGREFHFRQRQKKMEEYSEFPDCFLTLNLNTTKAEFEKMLAEAKKRKKEEKQSLKHIMEMKEKRRPEALEERRKQKKKELAHQSKEKQLLDKRRKKLSSYPDLCDFLTVNTTKAEFKNILAEAKKRKKESLELLKEQFRQEKIAQKRRERETLLRRRKAQLLRYELETPDLTLNTTKAKFKEMLAEARAAYLENKKRLADLEQKKQPNSIERKIPKLSYSEREKKHPLPDFDHMDIGIKEPRSEKKQKSIPVQPVLDIPIPMAVAPFLDLEKPIDGDKNRDKLNFLLSWIMDVDIKLDSAFNLLQSAEFLTILINKSRLLSDGSSDNEYSVDQQINVVRTYFQRQQPDLLFTNINKLDLNNLPHEVLEAFNVLQDWIVDLMELIDKRKDFYQAHPMLLPELELLCASQQVDSVEALAYFLAHIHMRSFENKQDEKLYGARRSEVRNRPPIEQMLAVLEITPMRDIYSNSSDVLSNLLSPPPDIFKPESVKSPSSWLMQFAPQEMRQAITEQYALVFEAFHQKIPAVHEGRIPLHLISHNEPEKVGGKKEGVDALLEYAVGLNKPASFYETILPLIIKIYAESQLTQSGKLNTTHFLSGMVAWYQSSISSKGLLNQPFFDKLSMPTQTLDERLNELKKRYNDDKENYSYTNLLRDQEEEQDKRPFVLNIPPTEIYYNLGSVLGALRLIDRFIKKHGIDSSIYGFTHLVDSEYSPATADDRLSIVEILVQKLVENGYCRIDEENNLLLTPGTPGLMKATTIARLAGATRASIKIFTELLADLRSEQFCSLELAKTEVAKLVELGELSADWAYWLLPEHTIKSQLVFDRAVVGDNGFESLTLTLFRNFQELFDKLELEVFRYSSAHISNYFDNPYTSQDPKARNKELLLTFVRPFFSSMVLMILSGENDQIITDATPEDREQYGVQNSKGVIVTAKSKAVAMLLNLIKEFDNLVAANKESEIYDLMDQMKIVLKEYEESNTVKSDLDEKSATQLVKPLLKDGLSSCLLLTPPSMEDYSPKRIADVLNLTEEQYVQWVQRAVDVNIETHKEAGSTVDTQSREPMSQEEIKRLVREKLLEFNTFVSLPEREAEEVLSMIVEIVNNWLHPIEKGSPEIIGVKKKRFLTPFLDIIEQIIAFFKRRF